MDFEDIREKLDKRGIEELSSHVDAYKELQSRIEYSIKMPQEERWGAPDRIRQFSLILRQTFLHRAIKLFEGAFEAYIHDNGYSMVLSIRGHFETTAAIGYLHYRLNSLQQGNLESEMVDRGLMTQLLGTRDGEILKTADELGISGVEAKQVLSMLQYADKSVSKHIMKGTVDEHSILMQSYEYLCEFSHPNFHSNILAFTLNKAEREAKFMYNKEISKEVADLIQYLLISAPIFVDLYDRIEKLLPSD